MPKFRAPLRYCDLIRLDKLYYDTGSLLSSSNGLTTRLWYYRYLDIYEVIEDPVNNNLGYNNDFTTTDIPSLFDVPLTEKNHISGDKIEIKNWLLDVSMK